MIKSQISNHKFQINFNNQLPIPETVCLLDHWYLVVICVLVLVFCNFIGLPFGFVVSPCLPLPSTTVFCYG